MAKIKLKEYKATASKANKKAIKSNIDTNPCHCGNLPIGLEEAHRRNAGKKRTARNSSGTNGRYGTWENYQSCRTSAKLWRNN